MSMSQSSFSNSNINVEDDGYSNWSALNTALMKSYIPSNYRPDLVVATLRNLALTKFQDRGPDCFRFAQEEICNDKNLTEFEKQVALLGVEQLMEQCKIELKSKNINVENIEVFNQPRHPKIKTTFTNPNLLGLRGSMMSFVVYTVYYPWFGVWIS